MEDDQKNDSADSAETGQELSPREAAMQRRVESVRNEREENESDAEFELADEAINIDKHEPVDEIAPGTEQEQEQVEDTDEVQTKTYTAKVDGQDEEFTAEEIRYAAKTRAADKRFREAAALRVQAEQERVEAERLRKENEELKKRPAQEQKAELVDLGAAFNELVDARLDGNQTRANEITEQLSGLATGAGNTPDVEQLVEAEVSRREQAKTKDLYDLRQQEIASYYPDWIGRNEQIANDPTLYNMVDDRVTKAIQENPERNAVEIMDSVTTEVKDWMASKLDQGDNGLENRTNVKRRVSGQQRTNGARRKGNVEHTVEEARSLSREKWIAQQRETRAR